MNARLYNVRRVVRYTHIREERYNQRKDRTEQKWRRLDHEWLWIYYNKTNTPCRLGIKPDGTLVPWTESYWPWKYFTRQWMLNLTPEEVAWLRSRAEQQRIPKKIDQQLLEREIKDHAGHTFDGNITAEALAQQKGY